MPAELIVAIVLVIALIMYAILGGTDYGVGVWVLFSHGKRGMLQRDVISRTISPIWEANHVWLILINIVLFTAYPLAYGTIVKALFIPLSLVLIGIVMRGAAYTFKNYNDNKKEAREWAELFGIASLVTPILLGVNIGAISSGKIIVENDIIVHGFIYSWLSPFSIAVGFFALVLFAYLAAVSLILESHHSKDLQDDFRRRAMISLVLLSVVAIAVYITSSTGAPTSHINSFRGWALILHLILGIISIISFIVLYKRKYHLAKFLAYSQATLMLLGWAFTQYPYIVREQVTIYNAGAPKSALHFVIIALIIAACFLIPSFFYMYKVFRKI